MKQLSAFFSDLFGSKILLKFALLIFFTEFVRGAYMAFFPLYSKEVLGNNNISVYGTVFFAYFFVETISKIVVGWILDRFNNRVTLLIGLGISFTAFYALKFITSPTLLIVDGGLIGFGFAPVWLIVLGHVSTFAEEKRSAAMGMIYASWFVGLGLGTVLITFIISKSFGIALNMIIFFWLFAIILGFFIDKGIKSEVKKNEEETSAAAVKGGIIKVLFLIPGMILQTFSITMVTPIISVYFTGPLGLTKFQYGTVQAALGITTVGCLVVLSRFTGKLGVKNLFLLGLLLASIGIFAVGHAESIGIILISGIIIGISYSAILPSWYTIMSMNIPEKNNGLIWGIFSTLEGIGRSLGPLFGGFIAQYYTMRSTFSVSAAVMFGLAVFYFILNKTNSLGSVQRAS